MIFSKSQLFKIRLSKGKELTKMTYKNVKINVRIMQNENWIFHFEFVYVPIFWGKWKVTAANIIARCVNHGWRFLV